MSKTVEIEDLQQAVSYLKQYINEIDIEIKSMKQSMQDCHDNLDGDTISKQRMQDLENALKGLNSTIALARELQAKIQKKIIEIIEV